MRNENICQLDKVLISIGVLCLTSGINLRHPDGQQQDQLVKDAQQHLTCTFSILFRHRQKNLDAFWLSKYNIRSMNYSSSTPEKKLKSTIHQFVEVLSHLHNTVGQITACDMLHDINQHDRAESSEFSLQRRHKNASKTFLLELEHWHCDDSSQTVTLIY